MKKIIIKALLLSILSTSAMAMNEGFYAGLGVGALDVLSKLAFHDVDADGVDSSQVELGSSGAQGSLALGYNFLFSNQFLLGLQLDGQISGEKTSINSLDSDIDGITSSSVTGKFKHSFGLNVRPGILFNDNASGFLVLGYRHAKLNYNFQEAGSDEPFSSFSLNQNSNGFEYGLGTELCLNDQLGLRLEVSQTQYQSKNFSADFGQSSLNSKMKVNQGLLSLIWYPSYF